MRVKEASALHVESASIEGRFREESKMPVIILVGVWKWKRQGQKQLLHTHAYFTILLVFPQLNLITVFNCIYFGVGVEGRSLLRWQIGRLGKGAPAVHEQVLVQAIQFVQIFLNFPHFTKGIRSSERPENCARLSPRRTHSNLGTKPLGMGVLSPTVAATEQQSVAQDTLSKECQSCQYYSLGQVLPPRITQLLFAESLDTDIWAGKPTNIISGQETKYISSDHRQQTG